MTLRTPGSKQRITASTIAIAALLLFMSLMGWTLVRRADPIVVPPASAVVAPAKLRQVTPPRPLPTPGRKLLPPGVRMTSEDRKAYQLSRLSTFENRYRQDGADAAWAMHTENKMLDAAAEPALNQFGTPDSYDADCQAHLCKIVMVFDDLPHAQDWEQFYVTGLGEAVTRVVSSIQVQPDGKANLLIYGTRAGAERLLDFPPPQVQPGLGTAPGPDG